MMAVNIYDLLILDIGILCHDKRLIIPGTEDMIADYKNPAQHLRGSLIETAISLILGLGAGSLVAPINMID